MASTKPFLSAVEDRRSIYTITSDSPIPDSRIQEIVEHAVKYTPSPFNIQSTRALVLLGDHHRKLWQLCASHMKGIFSAEMWQSFEKRFQGFEGGHGTVIFFEDDATLEALKQSNPKVAQLLPEWRDNVAGIAQFIVWTALEAEGLAGSLQHYQFHTGFVQDIQKNWDVPEDWKPTAQLVFGKPTNEPLLPKTFKPIEERVRVVV